LLATAFTRLLALNDTMSLARLPDVVRRVLHPISDPIRLA
jgi:hypothetical protein